MPAAVPLAIVAGSAISGAIASHAASKSANTQADTTLKAATLQDEAAKRQLAYEQQQSDIANANAEVNRKANYDQYVAQRQRMSGIAQHLGLPAENIPAYTPGVYTTGGIGTPSAPAPGAGTAPGTPAKTGDPVMDALTANYAALGVKPTGPGTGPTDIAYMAQKINETGGATPDNLKYWIGPNGRIAQELVKSSGGGAPAQGQSMATQTLGSLAAPTIAPAAAAASPIYQRQNPYTSGTIGGLSFQG